MCRWVVRRVVSEVYKGRNAFFFKIKHELHDREDKSVTILLNIQNY
jgi:hypothetical protein